MSIPVTLSFKNSSLNFSVYRDPITQVVKVGGASSTINTGGINFTWKKAAMGGDFVISEISLWATSNIYGNNRVIPRSNLYLEGTTNKKKIYIEALPKSNVNVIVNNRSYPVSAYTDRFNSIPVSNFGFENQEYKLVFSENPKLPLFVGETLESKTSSNSLKFSIAKFSSRISASIASNSSIKVYKNTSGNFILLGGGTSIALSPSVQYQNGSWITLPGAAISIKTNTGKILSLSSGSLNLSQLTASDTRITLSYAGSSEVLASANHVINLSYNSKIETRCSFEDSSTIFMGKRTSSSTVTKTDDLIDISRSGRLKYYATPTPGPTATNRPTSTPTPSPTPTRTPTPTPTSTNTPTPAPTIPFTYNYNTQSGGNLIPWRSSATNENNFDTGKNFIAVNRQGTRVVVGSSAVAKSIASQGNPEGVVRVFNQNSSTKQWEKVGSDIFGTAPGERFGSSVSIDDSGTYIAVGSILSKGASSSSTLTGKVTIYKYISTGWAQVGNAIYGTRSEDDCGYDINLNSDGTKLAISFRGEDTSSNNPDNIGIVRVFSYNSTNNTWTKLGNDIVGTTSQSLFGSSLALNDFGDIVIVGQARNVEGGAGAKVFKFQNNSWGQVGSNLNVLPNGKDTSPIPNMVSINSSGNTVAVSDYTESENSAGIVKIYKNNNNSWGLIGTLNGQSASEYFGFSLSLNAVGDRIVVTAPQANNYQGAVNVFEYAGGTSWTTVGQQISIPSSFYLGSRAVISKNNSNIIITALYGGVAAYGLQTSQPSVTNPPQPTRTPTPTPTQTQLPTRTPFPSPTPTATFPAINNIGYDYSVANFKTTLEYFDASSGPSGQWKVLSGQTALITCPSVYPQRTLLPDADMPLTTAQIDTANRLVSDKSLSYICSYGGTSIYNACTSSIKKIVYVNNYFNNSFANISPSTANASGIRTYTLPQITYLSQQQGVWNVPASSPLALGNTTLYLGRVESGCYNLAALFTSQSPPNFSRVAFSKPGTNLASIITYQKGSGVTSGANLTFSQEFELDYIVEGQRLKAGIRLNLTEVK